MISLKLVQRVPVFSGRVIQRAPVVGESEIYLYNAMVVSRRHGGEMAALDRKTLSVKWRLRFEEFGPEEVYDSRFLIIGDWNAIGAVDVAAQRVVWSRESAGRLWQRHLLVDTPTGLDLVDPATGDVRDSIAVNAGPAAFSGDVFVGPVRSKPGIFMGFDVVGRRRLWERDLLQELRTRFGLQDPVPFGAFSGSIPGQFLAGGAGVAIGCSLQDGAIRWKADVDLPYVPQAVEGKIPVLYLGRFVVIDEATGRLLCDERHGTGLMVHERKGSILGGRVVFTSESGHVAMFDIDSGLLLWREEHKVTFWGSVEADNRLLVPASDGKLWVFEGANGS